MAEIVNKAGSGARVPDGLGRYPVLGGLPDFARDPLNHLMRSAREKGDFVRLKFPGAPIYLISHPDDVEYVLVKTGRGFTKGRGNEVMRLGLGNGLIMSNGDFWRRQRRLSQPAFHKARIKGYGDVMARYARRWTDRWRSGEVYDVHAEMTHLTLEIVAKCLFDADPHTAEAQEVAPALKKALNEYTREMTSFLKLPKGVPTPRRRRLNETVRLIEGVVYRIIDERRANEGDRGDLLSMLMAAQDLDGTQMTSRQLRDELMNLYIAGHETTANTLTWTFYFLSQHPEVDAKMHEEFEAVLGDRLPEADDVALMPYTAAVLKEVMRLYPPVWVLARQTFEDIELGGHHVPAGTELWMSQWVVHRDERFFENADTFRPERWLDGLEKRIHKYAYFPFGGGPRLCIGNNFANMEATLVLATILRRFRLKVLPDHPVEIQPSVTIRPKHGLKTRLIQRA